MENNPVLLGVIRIDFATVGGVLNDAEGRVAEVRKMGDRLFNILNINSDCR
jgi:hypothetical protein